MQENGTSCIKVVEKQHIFTFKHDENLTNFVQLFQWVFKKKHCLLLAVCSTNFSTSLAAILPFPTSFLILTSPSSLWTARALLSPWRSSVKYPLTSALCSDVCVCVCVSLELYTKQSDMPLCLWDLTVLLNSIFWETYFGLRERPQSWQYRWRFGCDSVTRRKKKVVPSHKCGTLKATPRTIVLLSTPA